MSKSFEPVAENLPVDIIFPEHDILVMVAVPLQVIVGPEIIPELATLPAVNIPALSVPELVRVPVVVRLTALSAPLLVMVPEVVRAPAVINPVHPKVPELRMLVVESVLRLIVIHGTVETIFEYT